MFTNRPNKCYKTEDGPIWHSRSVAVVGIVFVKIKEDDDIFVLVTKRSPEMEDMPGRWCLPCGYLDWDEDLEHATAREICEETSFNVYEQKDMFKYLNFSIRSNIDSDKQNISIASAYFIERLKLPKISISLEASEVEWVSYKYWDIKEKKLVFGHERLIEDAWDQVDDSFK